MICWMMDDESQDWVHLFHVFLAMEMKVRKVLSEGVVSDIAESEDGSFWSLVCGDWDEESSTTPLQMVVNQYIFHMPMHWWNSLK